MTVPHPTESRHEKDREGTEIQRKRLRWRCWRRGTRENDLLLGRVADGLMDTLHGWELDALESLLECSDRDLYAWMIHGDELPITVHPELARKIISHVRTINTKK